MISSGDPVLSGALPTRFPIFPLPGAILLDEPTRGMDRARKDELRDWLDRLASAGSAVLVATHDVELAASFADRVILLADGRAIAEGPPATILTGGWYFATEVPRILGDAAASPEEGARVIRDALTGERPGATTTPSGSAR